VPVSFEVYPRRIVRLPNDTHALVLIRRNVDAKLKWWNGFDQRWERARLGRLVRRDRTWRVEIYEGISEDPISLPSEDAVCMFIGADKSEAVDLAERVVARIASSGIPAIGDAL
jgi:hypothetical protein